ncbi:uncharacterized protein METZ01_LOCUS38836 [marine metagenome]|uniref:Uncharacterized protein n=1 Tax=marine metagenome TaxID=408172 RepID=A0A381R2R5_9ZZZZ
MISNISVLSSALNLNSLMLSTIKKVPLSYLTFE